MLTWQRPKELPPSPGGSSTSQRKPVDDVSNTKPRVYTRVQIEDGDNEKVHEHEYHHLVGLQAEYSSLMSLVYLH